MAEPAAPYSILASRAQELHAGLKDLLPMLDQVAAMADAGDFPSGDLRDRFAATLVAAINTAQAVGAHFEEVKPVQDRSSTRFRVATHEPI